MDNPQAFPNTGNSTWDQHPAPGMTLLDYFAGQALAGLLSANATYGGRTDNRAALAGDAYAIARAMLTARQENSRAD